MTQLSVPSRRFAVKIFCDLGAVVVCRDMGIAVNVLCICDNFIFLFSKKATYGRIVIGLERTTLMKPLDEKGRIDLPSWVV